LPFALDNQAIGPSSGMVENKINAPSFAVDVAVDRGLAGKDRLFKRT